jgi:hypothetical protein
LPDEPVSVVQPAVQVRTITVGGTGAEVAGFTSSAIQTALDALRETGGSVRLSPGTYEIIAPVRLWSHVSLSGSGPETVLKKAKGFRTRFTADADYGELRVAVEDASGFTPGMAVQVFDEDQASGWAVSTAKVVRIEDAVLFLDDFLVRDYRADRGGTVSNACSIVAAVEAEDVSISDLTVDGAKENNDAIDGCRGGGVYLHKVKNATVRNVVVEDFNGDGISWQITERVTVRGCDISGCTNSGLHPGTGSPWTLIEGNNSHDNGRFGMFICWRVREGLVRGNRFHHNGAFGICTGHKDTDMVFEDNRIHENACDGVHFRFENESNAPHRNVFRNNTVENNGTRSGGYGFSFDSPARDVVLENNVIRNTAGGKQKAAVCVDADGIAPAMKNNRIEGHSGGVTVFEKNPNGI